MAYPPRRQRERERRWWWLSVRDRWLTEEFREIDFAIRISIEGREDEISDFFHFLVGLDAKRTIEFEEIFSIHFVRRTSQEELFSSPKRQKRMSSEPLSLCSGLRLPPGDNHFAFQSCFFHQFVDQFLINGGLFQFISHRSSIWRNEGESTYNEIFPLISGERGWLSMYTRISSSSSTLSLETDITSILLLIKHDTQAMWTTTDDERGVSSLLLLLLVVLWLKEWLINCCFPLSSFSFWKGIEYDRTCQESTMRFAGHEWNPRPCRVAPSAHPTIDIYIHTDWKIGCSPRGWCCSSLLVSFSLLLLLLLLLV